jgi:tRNA nucleotidyltransferase (CCA-adding enzyme)
VPVADWDVEVFGIAQEDLVRLLRKIGAVSEVGRSFGVYKWRPRAAPESLVDVSIPRRDSKTGPGHRGIAVMGDPLMTIEEAARRRDLTINALMWDVTERTLVDPFRGRADLEAGVLRAVDEQTFLEDPLRALRVVQFAARFEMQADPSLVALCRRADLDELPAERVQGEWGKLLLKGRRPSIGLAFARDARILERVFPEAATLETDQVLDALATGPRAEIAATSEGRAWTLMLAGWLHPATPAAVTATLDRLWLHTFGGYAVREQLVSLVRSWRDPLSTDADLRRLSTRAEVWLVLLLRAAVERVDHSPTVRRATELGVLTEPPAPLLLGRHLQKLGIPPGPHMGRILSEVYARQLDGTVTDLDTALAAARALTSI